MSKNPNVFSAPVLSSLKTFQLDLINKMKGFNVTPAYHFNLCEGLDPVKEPGMTSTLGLRF